MVWLIGIVAVFIIAFFIVLAFSGGFWYERFKIRNKEMQKLADEFHLAFQSRMPLYGAFIFKYAFGDVPINEMTGTINGHSVSVQDMCVRGKAGVVMEFLDDGRGIPFMPTSGSGRLTIVQIDGQKIPYPRISVPILRTTDEVRGILAGLS